MLLFLWKDSRSDDLYPCQIFFNANFFFANLSRRALWYPDVTLCPLCFLQYNCLILISGTIVDGWLTWTPLLDVVLTRLRWNHVKQHSLPKLNKWWKLKCTWIINRWWWQNYFFFILNFLLIRKPRWPPPLDIGDIGSYSISFINCKCVNLDDIIFNFVEGSQYLVEVEVELLDIVESDRLEK